MSAKTDYCLKQRNENQFLSMYRNRRFKLLTFVTILLLLPLIIYHRYINYVKSEDSFLPVQCHKCSTSADEVSNPKNWIPKEPFLYYEIFGGLGNQLFQYACVYTICKKNRLPLLVYVDAKPGSKLKHGEFALHLFNIPLPDYDRTKVSVIGEYLQNAMKNSRIEWISDEDILSQSYEIKDKILRINDYCQAEAFFLPYRDEIKRFFKPKNIKTTAIIKWKSAIKRADEINDSVCVHIRRGDYTYTKNRLVNTTFYTKSMQEMRRRLKSIRKSPIFFMFSDNIKNVKTDFEALEDSEQLQWVSGSETMLVEDLYLMSQCRHNILSGSSFGWWGAYLNDYKQKIVIAAHFKKQLLGNDMYHQFEVRHFYYPVDWFVREAEYVN